MGTMGLTHHLGEAFSDHPFFFFLNFLAVLRGMQDRSSQPKIKPEPLAVEAGSLNHWTAREVPDHAS